MAYNACVRSAGSRMAQAFLALAALIVAMTAGRAAAGSYYVDNTNGSCSDGGTGASPSLPFCTLTKAATQAVAGDTVSVLAGTYAEVAKPNSGTAGNPVVFSAAPGVTVTGPPGNATNGGGFRMALKSYVVVDGFTITGTADYGIILDTSDHITISNNHVSYAGTPGSDPLLPHRVGIYLRATTYSVIQGNVTEHNTMDGIRLNTGSNYNTVSDNVSFGNAEGTARNATGINVLASSHNTIMHNVVYGNEDSGLNFYASGTPAVPSSYNLVVGNISYGNGDHGIDNNASPDNTIIGNTVQGNVTVGINLEGAISPGSGRATVMNNVVVDNGLLRQVGGGTSSGSPGNIRVDANSQAGTTLDYNLYELTSGSGGTVQVVWGPNYTSLAAFKAAVPGQEVHGLEGGALLAAPAPPAERPAAAPWNVAVYVGDNHITAGSLAIDSANADAPGEPTLDIDGHARIDDPATVDTGAGARTYDDRGAYEFQPPSFLCGDGVVDPGEQCDEGLANGTSASCCSAGCSFADEFEPCGDGNATACNAADSCDATGSCIDRKKGAGDVCLPGSGPCDPDDVCDGTSDACAPVYEVPFTWCGDGDETGCNAADSCDATGTCIDRRKGAGDVCLPGSGPCDPDDVCDGTTDACAPRYAANGTICRSSAGVCDVAESCDGVSGACPTDGFEPSSTVCRTSAGTCDVAEFCTGSGPTCPLDTGQPDGDGDTVCDAIDNCVDIPNTSQGNADADALGDACDPCTNIVPTVQERAKVTLKNLLDPVGDEKISAKGFFLDMPPTPIMDPVSNGLRFLVRDVAGGNVIDVTIPPGAYNATDLAGWKVNSSSTTWTYKNKGTVVPLVNGITKMQLKAVASTPGKYKWSVKGKNGTYAIDTGNLPITAMLVIDGPYAESGQCGEATFPAEPPMSPSCESVSEGRTVRCK